MAINDQELSTMTTIMAPTSDANDVMERSHRDIFVLFLYLITSIIAMIGNVFVCTVIIQKRRLQSTTYKLIFSMAVADIAGGFVIPAQWFFCSTLILNSGSAGRFMCGLMKSAQILSFYLSSLTMMAIAYDRFRLVCYPTSSRINVKLILVLIWMFGLIFITGNVVSLRISEYFSPKKGLITCRVIFQGNVGFTFRRIRSLTLMITQYFIPLGLTFFFYSFVINRIWIRKQMAGKGSQEKQQKFGQKKRRTIKMLIVVTVVFGLSFLPTHIFHFLMFYSNIIPQRKGTCYASTLYTFSYWLGISSCAYNPFIYCYFNEEFRREALKWWHQIIFCSRKPSSLLPQAESQPPTDTNQTESSTASAQSAVSKPVNKKNQQKLEQTTEQFDNGDLSKNNSLMTTSI